MEIFDNREFRSKMKETAKIVLQTGREAGFRILRKTNTLKMGPVYKGNEKGLEMPAPLPPLEQREGTFHFHTTEGAIVPSRYDLLLLSEFSWAHYKYLLIGQIDSEEITILAIQLLPRRVMTPTKALNWKEEGKILPRSEQGRINERLARMGLQLSQVSFQRQSP